MSVVELHFLIILLEFGDGRWERGRICVHQTYNISKYVSKKCAKGVFVGEERMWRWYTTYEPLVQSE